MAVDPRSSSNEADDKLPREVWVVAGVVVLGVIMSILDTTIVNVALKTLSEDLNSPLSTIQWVSAGYLLALAVVIPLSGWASETFGSKRIWMFAVTLFGIGSALCGLAWSANSLIFFRVIQGFGGGLIMPVGMALLAQTAGPKRIGRVMSVIGVPMLLGPILGPVIGGAILDGASWRWIFYVNIPIAAIALVLAHRLLKSDAGRAKNAGRLDWRGFGLLSPGLVGIVFGLSEVETQGGIGDPLAFGPMLLGLIMVGLFVRHSLNAKKPLIDANLFRNGAVSASAMTTFCLGGALFGAMLVIPLYYQVARGESPLTAGLLMAPQGLGAAMIMPIAGRLTDKIGGGRVAVVGTTVMTIGTIPLALVGSDTSFVLLAFALVVRGFGLGASMMPAISAAYASLESSAVPRATSAINAIQRVGGSLGVALLAVVLQHNISSALGTGASGSDALQQAGGATSAAAAGQLGDAFANTFWWAVGLSALAIVPAFMLARQPSPRRKAAETPSEPATAHAAG